MGVGIYWWRGRCVCLRWWWRRKGGGDQMVVTILERKEKGRFEDMSECVISWRPDGTFHQ
jgi:hypothetical protein